jgi:methylenetetrahydrofolate--tRNA-(uracil-5-)-methyltransferase
MKKVKVIGGGLAGPEAALQAASFGCEVHLYEMRPHRSTEAHQTSDFAELVCSNSLKSESENSASWLLKQEMRQAGSFLLQAADATAVPAGHALAVDRELFSARVRARLEQHPNITIHRKEVTHLDEHAVDTITILASGPLTSTALAAELQRLTGSDHLAFYDSISPIVDASTIDMSKVYLAARWDKGTADYINCPFSKDEYNTFLDALITAEHIEQKSWEQLPTDGVPNHLANEPRTPTNGRHPEQSEGPLSSAPAQSPGVTIPAYASSWLSSRSEGRGPQHANLRAGVEAEGSASLPQAPTLAPIPEKLQYFEGCLPIEETARRGRDTLRFGPMKPAGLTDPRTGRWPYACVQLRQENLRADSYNLVGFQNHLKFSEQARVLRLIPGLEHATFLRYGQIHRNTYIHAPSLLTETLQLKQHPNILIAGQLSGVEGYTESIASGLLAGRYAATLARGLEPEPAPHQSANGSLTHYITHADQKKFQPANITFDLLPPLEVDLKQKIRDKKERHRLQCNRALEAWTAWLRSSELTPINLRRS